MFDRIVVIVILVSLSPVNSLDWQYHNNTELEKFMKNFTASTKGIQTQIYSIGKSSKSDFSLKRDKKGNY